MRFIRRCCCCCLLYSTKEWVLIFCPNVRTALAGDNFPDWFGVPELMDHIGEVDASSSTLTEPLLLIDDDNDDDDLRLTSFPRPRHGPSRSSDSFQVPQDSDHDIEYNSDSDNNLSCIPRTTGRSLWVIIAVPLVILLVLLFLFASLLPHHA